MNNFKEIAFGGGPVPRYMILEVPWDGLWTILLGSHYITVTALGSCVWEVVLKVVTIAF